MKEKFTVEQLQRPLEKMINITCVYIDHVSQEVRKVLDEKKVEDLSDLETERFNNLYAVMATLLDIVHRSYPIAYGLFKDHKDELDNIYATYKRLGKTEILKECSCDFCKSHPAEKPEETLQP